MNFNDLISNRTLICAVTAWAVAQLIKFFLYWWLNKKINLNRLIGAGGMPSSHSSTVTALVISSAKCYGIASFEFTIAFILAVIVIHDARGVRLQAGRQAEVINKLISAMQKNKITEFENMKLLKELIGHTPFQVLVGIIIGIITGILI